MTTYHQVSELNWFLTFFLGILIGIIVGSLT